ncbi:hypothetical protein ACQ4PT_035186 [Festuca glaucescens]
MALDSVPSYPGDMGSSSRATRQQRIRKEEQTWTADTYAPYDDGHQWRKYGEKKLSNSNFPRSASWLPPPSLHAASGNFSPGRTIFRFYYRCTYKTDMKCPATKQVQQKDTSDLPLFTVTYFNHHSCSTTSRPIGSTPDTAEQPSSRKAVSICFGSQASEQPTFLTSPSMLQSPASRASQQQDTGTYSRQFQWTDTSPSAGDALVKMEADDLSGTSSSSVISGGALSRTLLPIGQSRCIEYFQFL